MTVIDTSVMVSLLKGTPDSIKNIKALQEKNHRIAITAITAYELLKGAFLSFKQQENLSDVKKAISTIEVLDLSSEACFEAAQIYGELKKSGQLICEFDVLIAAIAKTNGEEILTYDRHFEVIPGLKLCKWQV
jgi:tRNA(fMet)-specific endonuclease VapC